MNEWSKGFWSESVVLEKYWTDKDYKDVDQEWGWWILDINFIYTIKISCRSESSYIGLNTAISYKVLVNLHSKIGRIGPEIASYDECLLLWATFVLTTFLYLVKKLVKTLGVLILFLEL